MSTLSGLTLAQLRAATVTQIRAAMKARIDLMSKRQLIILDLWTRGFDPDALLNIDDDPAVNWRPDGQVASQTTVQWDTLGTKVGTRQITWTYYPKGEVDTITIRHLDATDQVASQQVIKHYLDGKQPTTSLVVSEAVIR